MIGTHLLKALSKPVLGVFALVLYIICICDKIWSDQITFGVVPSIQLVALSTDRFRQMLAILVATLHEGDMLQMHQGRFGLLPGGGNLLVQWHMHKTTGAHWLWGKTATGVRDQSWWPLMSLHNRRFRSSFASARSMSWTRNENTNTKLRINY